VLQNVEPLLKPEVEKPRLIYFLEKQMITPETNALGIGDVDDKRMANAIAVVTEAYQLASKPEVKQVFDRSFLPPKAERELKMPGK
jgi:NitT/TauT family transport system substrate-binding protein